jgi:hypothetical protein
MVELATTRLREIARITGRDSILIAARHGRGKTMTDAAADKVGALLDATKALGGIAAAHALIGGVAVGIHSGFPRATVDVDIAVDSTVERTVLVTAMTGQGFRLVGEFPHSVNFRHASGEPVQLALDISFDAMIARAESVQLEGQPIRIVCKQDLIDMKRSAAEDPARRKSKALRDQADVELLMGDVPDPDEGW